MTSLLLHIGTGKTGTTSIQKSLAAASKNDVLGDLVYPIPRSPSHNFIAAMYRPVEALPRRIRSNYSGLQGGEKLTRDINDFREKFFGALSDASHAVVSAEYLTNFEAPAVRALVGDLEAAGVRSIQVVAYVREVRSFYLAVVQQTLKGSPTFRSPARYRSHIPGQLKIWHDEFPDMIVRPFVRNRLSGGDVVVDLLDIARQTFDDAVVPDSIPVFPANESLSAEGMIFLQRYQRWRVSQGASGYLESGRVVQLLRESNVEIEQTTPALEREVASIVLKNNVRGEEQLEELFGVVFEARPEPADSEPRQRPSDAYAEVTSILDRHDPQTLDQIAMFCLSRLVEPR